MFQSMTGYAVAEEVFSVRRGKLEIRIEAKTVNSKFLDINIRSPRPYVSFDSEISRVVREFLRRGRLDLNVTAHMIEGTEREVLVNQSQVKALAEALNGVRATLGLRTEILMNDLLQVPEWLQMRDLTIDKAEEWPLLEKVLRKALGELKESRRLEGEALFRIIGEQRTRFQGEYQKFVDAEDQILKQLHQRAKERIADLFHGQNFDPQRLEQEVTLWCSRSDFKEESDRLRQHLKTFDELVAKPQDVGRKLEFLLQEMHREVNTMGTKCPDPKLTPSVIELKTCIDRMREQALNVE